MNQNTQPASKVPETSSEASRALDGSSIRSVMQDAVRSESVFESGLQWEGHVEGGPTTDYEMADDIFALLGPTDLSSDEDIIQPGRKRGLNLSGVFDDEVSSEEDLAVTGGGKLPPSDVINLEEAGESSEESAEESPSE